MPKQNTSSKNISIPSVRFDRAYIKLSMALTAARNGVIAAQDREESLDTQSTFYSIEAFLNDAAEQLAGNECSDAQADKVEQFSQSLALTTSEESFHSFTDDGTHLLSINADIPQQKALQEASNILCAVLDQLLQSAHQYNSESLYGTKLLAETVKALVDSVAWRKSGDE